MLGSNCNDKIPNKKMPYPKDHILDLGNDENLQL